MVALSPGDAAGEGDEDPPARTGTGSERFRVESSRLGRCRPAGGARVSGRPNVCSVTLGLREQLAAAPGCRLPSTRLASPDKVSRRPGEKP